MQPTKQTILHDLDNGKIGNCLSAVIASLLHMPIEDVPLFVSEDWVQKLNEWLAPKGLAYVEITNLPEVIRCNGITGLHHEVSGPSPRHAGWWHACVGYNGELAFDPHPSGQGVQVKSHGVFVALRPWEHKQPPVPPTAATDDMQALLVKCEVNINVLYQGGKNVYWVAVKPRSHGPLWWYASHENLDTALAEARAKGRSLNLVK